MALMMGISITKKCYILLLLSPLSELFARDVHRSNPKAF